LAASAGTSASALSGTNPIKVKIEESSARPVFGGRCGRLEIPVARGNLTEDTQ
jgi:hypothetical protein